MTPELQTRLCSVTSSPTAIQKGVGGLNPSLCGLALLVIAVSCAQAVA